MNDMEEWKEYTLGELTTDGKGTYGIAASAVDYCAELPTYLRITDINDDGTIDFNGLKSVDDPNSSKYVLQENDIVFARTGASTGRSYFYDRRDGKFVYAGFLIKFSLDPKKVNPLILKYYTHSKVYYNWVHSFENGATRGNINAKTFADMRLLLPPRNVQDSIATILSSLDDKIAVNRRICENLEAQAQALFKHWFIDFAPFKNTTFIETEMGKIPEGWRVGKLSELGEIVGGATPSKAEESYYTSKGIAWLTPKDLSNKLLKFTSRGEIDITQEGYNSCSAKLMPKGSVLFSSRAPIGYITIAKNDICTNQGFKSVVPKYAGTAYIYYLLKVNTKRIENMSTGTTFKEASGSLMKSLTVIIPPKSILDEYEASIAEIFKEQEIIEQESLRLSALRDTLLPKLMSGEIKV